MRTVGLVGQDPPGGLDAVDTGQPDVHEHQPEAARPPAAPPPRRTRPPRRRFQPVDRPDQRGRRSPEQRLVVDDENAGHVGAPA